MEILGQSKPELVYGQRRCAFCIGGLGVAYFVFGCIEAAAHHSDSHSKFVLFVGCVALVVCGGVSALFMKAEKESSMATYGNLSFAIVVALGMNAWHHTTSIHHSTVYENIIMRHLGAIFRVPLAAACTYFIYTSKAKAPKVE
mmetsp:Transcript_82400/g.146100  ORF Transcript_82400/g.146100 Transcript_82400/m.146100 type:complete len:143 (-) Transcript_82400:131-559(-)